MPERKALIGADPYFFFAGGLNFGAESAVLVKKRGKVHGVGQAKRVTDCPSQFTHLATSVKCLVREAKMPQGQCEVATVSHARATCRP